MRDAALIAWRSFIADQEELYAPLGASLQAQLKKAPVFPVQTVQACPPLEECLDRVHYSWFSPFLRSLPERDVKLFVACLTPLQAKGLKQALLLPTIVPAPLEQGKSYLRQMLLGWLAPEGVVPVALLPEDPLKQLLSWNEDELLTLVDLLSMHDLSLEMRHIIDTAKLKSIYAVLSKAQMSYLKTLSHKKETLAFKRIQLRSWQGDQETLLALLTQRGLNRIAKALALSHSGLVWHLAHRLDAERGELLLKLAVPLNHPEAGALLITQVAELAQSIKPPAPSML